MFITLTELRYVIALAQEKHFGRAAAKCFVSQPTLSIAIKKLEDNLGLQLFERNQNNVQSTESGMEIIIRAQQVIEAVTKIEEFAKHGSNPFATPLKLGAIHTVGPYLFPDLIARINESDSELNLMIEEGMTAGLSEKLINGELDVIIVAKPFIFPNISTIDLYAEDLEVILSPKHPWKNKKKISAPELAEQTILLLGSGHCFRDQVLRICPECSFTQSNNHAIITSSIETIKYMVAGNMGISIVPQRTLKGINSKKILHKPFTAPVPQREIVLAYRKGFSRQTVIENLVQLIRTI